MGELPLIWWNMKWFILTHRPAPSQKQWQCWQHQHLMARIAEDLGAAEHFFCLRLCLYKQCYRKQQELINFITIVNVIQLCFSINWSLD